MVISGQVLQKKSALVADGQRRRRDVFGYRVG